MRQIKFRAWCKTHKVFKELFLDRADVVERNVMHTYWNHLHDELENCKYEDWLQFTGLKDKNGVEIYEGDIIKLTFDVNMVSDLLWLSLFEQERQSGQMIREVMIPNIYQEPLLDTFEVIGNIYETQNY